MHFLLSIFLLDLATNYTTSTPIAEISSVSSSGGIVNSLKTPILNSALLSKRQSSSSSSSSSSGDEPSEFEDTLSSSSSSSSEPPWLQEIISRIPNSSAWNVDELIAEFRQEAESDGVSVTQLRNILHVFITNEKEWFAEGVESAEVDPDLVDYSLIDDKNLKRYVSLLTGFYFDGFQNVGSLTKVASYYFSEGFPREQEVIHTIVSYYTQTDAIIRELGTRRFDMMKNDEYISYFQEKYGFDAETIKEIASYYYFGNRPLLRMKRIFKGKGFS